MPLKLIRLYAGQAERVKDGVFRTNFNTAMLNNVRAVSLKTCTFRNTSPNIHADDLYGNSPLNDNVFSYLVGATQHSTTVVQSGFYTLTEVLNLINPDLQTNFVAQNPGATAVLSLDPISGKVILTTTGAVLQPITLQYSLHSINALLGNTQTETVTTNPYTFTDFPSLSGAKLVTISVKTKSPQTILNADVNKERHTNSIGAIPVNVPYLVLQTFTDPAPADSMLVFSYPEDLRRVDFSIRDEFGRPLLSQDLDFSVEMIVDTSS
jgi:hypothetical protein